MNNLRIISNISWFKKHNPSFFKKIDSSNFMSIFKSLFRLNKYQVAIVNGSIDMLMLYSLYKYLFPFAKLKVISIDLILSKPNNFRDHVIAFTKKVLFRKIDYFILYMKDIDGYRQYYGIDYNRVKYIPFKVNTHDYVITRKIVDSGYLFSGGVSKRDYSTLFEAVRGMDIEVIVLAPPNTLSGAHGTEIKRENIPENVTLVHDDGSPESWVDYMSKAKFVILPIKGSTISPTGVSTYLTAMALRKCVIISEGPATRNVIPEGAAIIVPPGDTLALREAVIRACEDDEFRERTARNGHEYAVSLKDHNRLVDDIIEFVGQVMSGREPVR